MVLWIGAAMVGGSVYGFPIAVHGTECLRISVGGTEPIIATYRGNSASYSNDLYLMLDDAGNPADDGNPANDRFIFNNHTSRVGSEVNLGSFPVGTELIFRLHVRNTSKDYLTGPANRNPDGRCHARAQADWKPGTTLVSFEDLYNGPFRYNDLSFSFTNTTISLITLLPASASSPVGTSHSVTATVQDSDGVGVAGRIVQFNILSGPNAGAGGTCSIHADCTTDWNGEVTFTYTGGDAVGIDEIVACFMDDDGEQRCSQTVTKEWSGCGQDGDPCDDGDACTADDVCRDSVCVGGPPPDCDDGDECTADSCESEEGCVHVFEDLQPPVGGITYPEDGFCTHAGVTIVDDFTDACDENLERIYDPAGGPLYSEHGDYAVTLTATDSSGNSASSQRFFTIDRVPPVVTILGPAAQSAFPRLVPFSSLFDASDADGATGGVVYERFLSMAASCMTDWNSATAMACCRMKMWKLRRTSCVVSSGAAAYASGTLR
ncbi:MAG: hypothetical protein Q9Q13_07030 [Acidobacteriota bacterium]|nr:hypothetical protein [Acidobacteriota bacterium]